MKKFVSMFMAMVVAFTIGPNVVVRAEDECLGDACRLGPDAHRVQGNASLTGWAWCKENPKDCAIYWGETVWNVTKQFGGKVWDETAWVRGKMADGAVTTWNALKNYNYTQLGENVKWCAHNPGDCAASVYDDAKEWIGDRVDDVAEFNGALQNFYDYDLNGQSKWPFWAMVGLAAHEGAGVAWSVTKLAGKAAWGTVKLGGKVIMLPARFAMKLFSPCYRAAFGG